MTTTDAATPGGNTHTSPADDRQRPAPMPIDTAPRRRQRGPVSRFFRSLFSHLLFAGAAVAGVLGYLYHQPILRDVGDTVCAEKVLGQWMTKSPASVAVTPTPAPAAAAPQSQAAASSEPQRPAPATVADAAPPPQPATAAPAATAPVAATAPAVTSAAPAPSPEALSKAEAAPATPIPSTGKPVAEVPAVEPEPAKPVKDSAATTATPSAAETKPEPKAETRAQPAETAALQTEPGAKPASESPSPRQKMLEEWVAARKAFAEGKTGAVAAYEDLSRAYPDVPELTGELGNIYFQQGKMKEAAAQYYETAQRLIRRGETGAAACLIDVMQRLDAEKAAALQSETQGAKCPASVN